MIDTSFAKLSVPKSGAVALLLFEGEPLGATAKALDEAIQGAIARALAIAEFKGSKGQTATLLAPATDLSRIVAVGLGKRAELTALTAAVAGGYAAAELAREEKAQILAEELGPELTAAVAEGAVLRAWRFDRYRTKEKPEEKPRLAALTILAEDAPHARSAFAARAAVAEGVFLTRELVSEPPNVLNPAEMAERCKALSKLGVEVEVFGPKEMKKLGFGALLGVAQGSANEPRLVVLQWHGAGKKNRKPLAFIGKGVTFDTGGISIKPATGMEDMKWDMAGAGAVVGLISALAGRKAKVDAVGLVGLVENMPSATAQRPSDVVRSASGQTIEVQNTDAEGRLVLADLLWYAQDRFNPRFMVNLATLTGAIIVALGHEHAGLFANDETLASRLIAAGTASGETLWRMPLGEEYGKQLKSDIADMKNVAGRPGGAVTAAQFLQRFVNGKPWAHLDIAGTAWADKDKPLSAKGATGFGVRLLERLVAEHYEG